MACFIVPAAEAVVTTVVKKAVEKKENHENGKNTVGLSFSRKLGRLNNMLWGGSAILAFEHFWHGEIVPFFPFLTNAADAASRSAMLGEMATVGVGMAVAVTGVWTAMVAASVYIERKSEKPVEAKQEA